MNIHLKVLIVSTIVTLCQGCAVSYSNRIEKRYSDVRLSSWTVAISRHSLNFLPLERNFVDYGSLIHPQAVLTLNSTILYQRFRRFKVLGGCWDLQRTERFNIRDCHVRAISRIFSGRLNAKENADGKNNYAVLVLNSPFDLGRKISVINVANNGRKTIYSYCYFYAATALSIINQDNYREKYVTVMAPYKAQLANNSVQAFKCDGGNYTQIVEDTYLSVASSAIIKQNYRGGPVVCQNNNTKSYEQIGFFNVYFNTNHRKPLEQHRSELFIDATFAHDTIYQLLNKYFKPTPY